MSYMEIVNLMSGLEGEERTGGEEKRRRREGDQVTEMCELQAMLWKERLGVQIVLGIRKLKKEKKHRILDGENARMQLNKHRRNPASPFSCKAKT
jgi:hypothetical protein